ncbi:hypothetical protein B0H14DRAFT_2393734 [Mycena olivaceomarginata]|nr:hypothetical protein B0H14DRAFT_2393734 [Mycena olivaceomarginata]
MSDELQSIQIIGERGPRYQIQRAGTDPKTGKPWEPSWTSKSSMAKDLVAVWKEKLRKIADEWNQANPGGSQGMWSVFAHSYQQTLIHYQ